MKYKNKKLALALTFAVVGLVSYLVFDNEWLGGYFTGLMFAAETFIKK